MASWIRWNSNGKPVSDGVIGTRGIVQCLSKNKQTFLCYRWYSILVLFFFKLFYFIGGVPPKPPFYWGDSPQTPLFYQTESVPALPSGMAVSLLLVLVCTTLKKKKKKKPKPSALLYIPHY